MLSVPSFFRPGVILAGAAQGGLAVLAGLVMSSCSSAPKAEVVVSVKDQRMGVYSEGHLKKQYVISTSKFGLGDKPGSCCTPLGKHEIIAKIGHGLPKGAVLKSRSWNGEVLKSNAPGRDPIVSRILWLRGMEKTNKNAMNRYIYIHGTPEEARLGRPASYGCIRMGMGDVVEVFNEINIGAKVVVIKGGLPHGSKADPVKEEAITPEAGALLAAASANTDASKAPPVPAAEPMKAESGASAAAEREHAEKKAGVKASKTASKKSSASAATHVIAKPKAHKDISTTNKSYSPIKHKQALASASKARS